MIADTTFLIDLLLDEPSAVIKAKELEANGIAILVGAPAIFELYVGASRSSKSEEAKSKIVSIVASLPQLPLDYESAKVAGEIYAAKMRAGSTIDPEDAMLAGISKVHGEPIITRNVSTFQTLKECPWKVTDSCCRKWYVCGLARSRLYSNCFLLIFFFNSLLH